MIGAVVVFVALNATLLLGTFYLQHSRGMSPALAGAITLPMAVAATVLRAVVRNTRRTLRPAAAAADRR